MVERRPSRRRFPRSVFAGADPGVDGNVVGRVFLTPRSGSAGLIGLLLLVSGPSVVAARPIELTAGFENRVSDNARQSSLDEKSDVESRFTLGVDYQSDPGVCGASLGGSVGYGYWWNNSYSARNYTDLSFDGNCQVSDRLVWQLSDELHDVTQNTRLADTPDNTTRKNVVSTGPQYTLRFGALDQVVLSAAYENTEYAEVTEPDSNRIIGTAAWNHLFDPTLTGGLSLNASRANLDTGEDIDRNSASVTFKKKWQASQASGSLGVSELKTTFRDMSQTSNAWVGRLSIRRQVNPSADVYLDLSRELTDQNTNYNVQFDGYSFNLQETAGVKVTSVRTGITKRFSDGSSLDTSLSADQSYYLRSGNQEDSTALAVYFDRPIITHLTLNLAAGVSYLKFDQDNRDDRILDLSTGLTYQVSRRLSLVGRIGHHDRTSDVADQEYTENWILLGLSYRLR